jgi:Uma2 family endonuclease
MIAHSPSAPFPKLSPEEYLQWEERQREKHEYLDGQVYAMGSYQAGDRVELKSVGLTFPVNGIYRGLSL